MRCDGFTVRRSQAPPGPILDSGFLCLYLILVSPCFLFFGVGSEEKGERILEDALLEGPEGSLKALFFPQKGLQGSYKGFLD